jgi:hypothetical protein
MRKNRILAQGNRLRIKNNGRFFIFNRSLNKWIISGLVDILLLNQDRDSILTAKIFTPETQPATSSVEARSQRYLVFFICREIPANEKELSCPWQE